MQRINFYTIKQVKESCALYEVEKRVTRPEGVANFLNVVLDLNSEACEKFGILTLNTKNDIVGVHILGMGSLNATIVHPREVFKAAMLNNAANIICFHNHPSGDPNPSVEDIELTNRLMDCGEMMGISVLDHIVIGDCGRFNSMKQTGVI